MVTIGELFMILDLHRQGLSISAIARQVGCDRKTVAKYIARDLEPPAYGPRAPRPTLLGPFEAYLAERVRAVPGITARRLLRELKGLGYCGGYTMVKAAVRALRPEPEVMFERRFETPPGRQAQVDFAYFRVRFDDEPSLERVVWLFTMVLGHSRFLWGRFVTQQDLATVLRCHIAAFEALGGAPAEILYDRMKTAVLGENDEDGIVHNAKLLGLAAHYGFLPRACKPYRAKTKGKIERPYRYVREDFFLGGAFRNLDDLNGQFRTWLDTIANPRVHATTRRVVTEAFAEELPHLKPLPAGPFNAVLTLDRRITRDGMVSYGGNLYSVPDGTGRRVVELQALADEIRILQDDRLIATHPILEGRGLRQMAPGHRRGHRPGDGHSETRQQSIGVHVTPRPLAVYEAVGRALAGGAVRP